MTDYCYLNGQPLPYFPNSISWDYTLNTASFDTLGGRVVQILSVAVNSITLQGDAGNRSNLKLLYLTYNELQNQQIQSQVSATLSLPSRGWSFNVWCRQFPNFGWDYQTVTYPYQLILEVDQNSGIPDEVANNVAYEAFSLLQDSIGFSSTWNGLNPSGQQGADQMLNVPNDPLYIPSSSSMIQDIQSIGNASTSSLPQGSN